MSNSEEDEPVRKKRRGVVHTDTYQRNKIRDARVKGEAYVNYKGNEVSQKTKPEGITCKCSNKCFLNVTDEVINVTWNNFYSLESKNTQDTYIQTLIETKEITCRRKKANQRQEVTDENEDDMEFVDDGSSKFTRNHSFIYNLKINGFLKRVCKNVFMKVHGLSRERLSRICRLLTQNKTPTDKRGKNRSGNAISEDIRERIHEHIAKFDVKETHYEGKPKKYLEATLNIRKMYELCIIENPDLKDKLKYSFYYSYYKENFGYSFGRPQVDVCSTCESLKAKLKDKCLNDNAKRVFATKLMVHNRRAKKFYSSMIEASNNKDFDTCIICFDFMKKLPLPNIPVKEIFYIRQLWVNVFSIHNLKTNKSKIYLYHEGVANKSPDEVCTFLLNYINTEIADSVKHLVLFSDGPPGQNKNHTMVRFLQNLCDRNRFSSITHNFPFPGHSYSACDRDFGMINRLLRKVDRIYTDEEYMELILRASTKNHFTVYKVKTEEILSFKSWWPASYKKMPVSDETSGKEIPKDEKLQFKVSTYKQFRYKFDEVKPGKVVAKLYIDGLQQSTFSLLKANTPPQLPTTKAYPAGKVPINIKKMSDLRKLTPYLVGYEMFYQKIFEWPTTTSESEQDLVEEDE